MCHSQQGLTQGRFSHLKQGHGFLEYKVSHVELRPNSHRRQGLTESKASQRVQHYEQRQSLREGRVSQKAMPHRSQGLTEGKASQKPGSHGRPGLAEGKTLEKAIMSLIAGTHTIDSGKQWISHLKVFSPVKSHAPELLLSSTAPTRELLLLTFWLAAE